MNSVLRRFTGRFIRNLRQFVQKILIDYQESFFKI